MTGDTILLRQAHPKFVSEGKVTSQAFVPFPKDDAKLSVYDGDQISAEESHLHYTKILKNESDSVWGVACSEVTSTNLSSNPDPLPDFSSHATIDFSGKSNSVGRKLAKKLKEFALARGRFHP
jgi:hypothetical protein